MIVKKNLFKKNDLYLNLIGSLAAIFVGLFVGFIILLFSNPSKALQGFAIILTSGFREGAKSFGNVLFQAVPITMTGLAVALAFKGGLFNIGTAGQFIIGAFTAIYVAIKWVFLPFVIRWVVALLMAAIAGGLWALLPAILHVFFNVNIVISSIMMNYVGTYTVNYLITNTIYNS
ncbi:MAG: ABC transporter permease, partial [Clostridiales bacterium]|nr:ABC transporter permease [Clostridiales bacterium]